MEHKRHTYLLRRPKFLAKLDEKTYKDAVCFLSLREGLSLTCSSWKDLETQVSRVGEVMHALCQHVAFWVDPTWRYPTSAATELKKLQWDLYFAEKIMCKRDEVWIETAGHEKEDDVAAEKLILEMWALVEEDNKEWHEVSRRTWVCDILV